MGSDEYPAQEEAQHFTQLPDVHLGEPHKPHTLVSSSTSICHMVKSWQTFPLVSFPRIEGKINSLELFLSVQVILSLPNQTGILEPLVMSLEAQ